MKHRTFPLRIERAGDYIAWLLANGLEFHVKPWTSRVDVTINEDTDPLYWPHEETLILLTRRNRSPLQLLLPLESPAAVAAGFSRAELDYALINARIKDKLMRKSETNGTRADDRAAIPAYNSPSAPQDKLRRGSF